MRLNVGNTGSVVRLYHQLREQRLRELLGLWVSEVEPLIFERVDVSPQVLVEVGIGRDGDTEPTFVGAVTVQDMTDAGALA